MQQKIHHPVKIFTNSETHHVLTHVETLTSIVRCNKIQVNTNTYDGQIMPKNLVISAKSTTVTVN